MSNKTALLLFTVSVLMTSFAAVFVPQANALIQRDFSVYDDSHTTASYGNSKVCGDHLCAPGEQAQWLNAIWQSQRGSYGIVGNAPHGEDVMHGLAGSVAPPMTSHGSVKVSDNMTASTIPPMTSNGTMKLSSNMTMAGNATNGTK